MCMCTEFNTELIIWGGGREGRREEEGGERRREGGRGRGEKGGGKGGTTIHL